MAPLDRLLLIVFSSIATVFLAVSIFCFSRAFKAARARDGELRMFFWAAGGMIGLVISGMSTAYILLPILL